MSNITPTFRIRVCKEHGPHSEGICALCDVEKHTMTEEKKPCGEYHPLPCGLDKGCPENNDE